MKWGILLVLLLVGGIFFVSLTEAQNASKRFDPDLTNCNAQERGTDLNMVLEAASGPQSGCEEYFGAPLAPPLWLINFLLLYFTNPENAANMPAYRASIPQEVYECLVENPDGCPYWAEMVQYFGEQREGSRNNKTFWPSYCQTDPKWQYLAPPENRHPHQINEPLGREKADELARRLGIDHHMVLNHKEYECMINGTAPPLGRDIIFNCLNDLTNSNRNSLIPLSSYGLSLDVQGNIRSNCAPHAACLLFNQLAKGPLEEIAVQCNFTDKLRRLFNETPLLEFAEESANCQKGLGDVCIAEATCKTPPPMPPTTESMSTESPMPTLKSGRVCPDDYPTVCSGVCVNTQSDPFNCGTCGFKCERSACVDGSCVLDMKPPASSMKPSARSERTSRS